MAFVGPLAGGPQDVALRIQRNFGSSIAALEPATCPAEGDPPKPVGKIEVVEAGKRMIGTHEADYRKWRVTCGSQVTNHRAWVILDVGVAIYEQVPAADTDAVLKTAQFER